MQVPAEDGKTIDKRLHHLGYDDPRAHAGTDAGGAWPYPVEVKRGQSHSEDPWHINKGAKEIKGKGNLGDQFLGNVTKALYNMMTKEELDALLDHMIEYTKNTPMATFSNNLSKKKENGAMITHLSTSYVLKTGA